MTTRIRTFNALMKVICTITLVVILAPWSIGQSAASQVTGGNETVQFLFTSDVHFGLTKKIFRGAQNVSAADVNAAMIRVMNRLPALRFPADGGVRSSKPVGDFSALVITGDIANREEDGIQPAAASWKQFIGDYQGLLQLKAPDGRSRIRLLLTPGNHDVSNAIGYRKPMNPERDATAMSGLYNLEMHPVSPVSRENYRYSSGKIHYAFTLGGIHLVFLNLWPDSSEQAWMERDLAGVDSKTPVLLFAHSVPDVEARFFTNPNGKHDINPDDKFENLLPEQFRDGKLVTDSALDEQRGFARFIRRHPNIKAYFHGNSNWNEFYVYRGPDKDVKLNTFRVDSPMKGNYSAKDETLLSFQLISLNPKTATLTVRECLWNTKPLEKTQKVVFGKSVTVSLQVD